MDPTTPAPCGCSLENGYCPIHKAMIEKIHAVWFSPTYNPTLMRRMWAHTDAYGPKGYRPPQGYDWSGIRDSSPEAIEQIWAIAIGRK